MTKEVSEIGSRDLEDLFERYRRSPEGYVFVLLADTCRKLGRLDEALEICEKGVEQHPSYASGFVVKGKCLFDKGDHEDAAAAFRHVLSLDAENLVALKYLGMVDIERGRYEEARRRFERILALDPENEEIHRRLRVVDERETRGDIVADVTSRSEGDEEEAVAEASRVVDVETSELASITLAGIFAEQGYHDRAADIYEELLRRDPENATIRSKLDDLTRGTDSPSNDEGGTSPDNQPSVIELPGPGAEEPPQTKPADGKKASREARPSVDSPGDRPAAKKVTKSKQPSPDGEMDGDRNLQQFKRWISRLGD